MNIEISDAMIEELVKKQVNLRVDEWFKVKSHDYVIKDYINQAVMKELEKFDYTREIDQQARNLVSKKVLDGVCSRISMDIAEAYAEKFGD